MIASVCFEAEFGFEIFFKMRTNATPQASSRTFTPRRPPVEYDHRAALRESSRSLVLQRFPDLADLVDAGTLVAVERSALYVERRTDGYVEPELVLLVGTSHASSASAEEVRRTIEVARPENVVVELCRSRSSVMYRTDDSTTSSTSSTSSTGSNASIGATPSTSRASNPLLLSGGEDFFTTFKRTLELGGQSAFLLRLILGKVSNRLASDMNVETAGEFIAARLAAELTGAQLVLGDRPIEVTLRRAWERLSVRQKIEFVSMMWSAYTSEQSEQSRDLLEALRKDDDAVNSMLVALSERFPELADAFIHERDLYLAWSLKRSKAVNGCQTVVGVVGKGHMRGVCYALTNDASGGLRFRDLAGRRPADAPTNMSKRVGRLVFETCLFVALWSAWTNAFL